VGNDPLRTFRRATGERPVRFYGSSPLLHGYAALHDCIGFMPETHMLKPFADRVRSTYAFMEAVLQLVNEEYQKAGN